jgi:ribose-phosphate pyrophosphokinase
MLRDKLAQLMVYDRDKYVMVSPDVGHSKATEIHAEALGIRIADSMYKKRNPTDGRVTHKGNVDDVDGRICFLMDDMIGTASTVASATEKLDQAGASDIYVAATHGWFSGSAAERLSDSPIVEIFVTDTIPIAESVQQRLGDKLQIVSAAQLIADGLAEILTGGSVSELYEGQNYA